MTLVESSYRFIYNYYNGDPASIYTLGMIGGIVAYYLANSIFLLIDFFEPEFLKPYKIQDGDKPSSERFWKAVRVCSLNILVVTPLCAPFFYYLGKYTAITSIYMHPVEHFFGNMIPELLGATLIGAHVTVVFFFAYYILWRATVNHSGYHLPFLSTPESHDYHHKIFNECYSQMGFLDALHGSDATWNESVEKQRNFASFSLVPMRIRFPDKKNE